MRGRHTTIDVADAAQVSAVSGLSARLRFTIPLYIRQYLCQQLHLPLETEFHTAKNLPLALSAPHSRLFGRHGVHHRWRRLVEQRVTQAAYTMSDPADLINVAIEHSFSNALSYGVSDA